MSQSANGDDNLARRNAWLYYLVAGGVGIVLLPFTVALHAELWPQLVAIVLLAGSGVVGFLTSWRTRKPRTLVVRPAAFEAPPAYFRLAVNAASLPPVVGILCSIVYDDDDWGVFTWMLFAVTLGCAYLMVYALVMLVRGTGRLVLRADGLTVVDATTTHEVPWAAIMSGPLPTVFGVGRLGILWPELVTTTGFGRKKNLQRIQLQLQSSAVHREFLHDSVNHYLNHPEDRGSIGTEEGLRHLLATLPA
ncbi:hypothetical protein ACQP1P_29120 [Dactylosporangium sp. CA-052675]|uniref:hypothetical protein n=1 Tax=Dactylosporangium sp. CA-052675 TaxID=3239927 RepID=UPI003D90F2BC